MAGISAEDLLGALRRAVGEADQPGNPVVTSPGTDAPSARPAVLATYRPVHLDVRDDIRLGLEPFARIMAAVRALRDGAALVLRAPFEPAPLYDVLGRRGLAHWTERRASDDWSVWFYGESRAAAEAAIAERSARGAEVPSGALRIDVRGLEPPQPLVRVLERLDTLGEAEQLEVIHDRRPVFLYPQLDERGFVHETDEPGPGVVRIRIRKRPRAGP
jgi:uncharacterized protein (DUF2249 family)